jgi:hypothetical protein
MWQARWRKADGDVQPGQDLDFHGLSFRWSGRDLRISRGAMCLVELAGITRLATERRRTSSSQLMLLECALGDGTRRRLFIEGDERQASAREVAADLDDLDAVLGWLLPPGYAYRQGDVGFYRREALPLGLRPVESSDDRRECEQVLGRRHLLDPPDACRLWVDGAAYVDVLRETRLVHPEHEPVTIEPGTYEIVAARGVPLPIEPEVRTAKEFLVVP